MSEPTDEEREDHTDSMDYCMMMWRRSVREGDGHLADAYLQAAARHADALLGRPVDWEDEDDDE